MIICEVDAWVSSMEKEGIEDLLRLTEEELAALDGELIGAEVGMGHGRLVAYVRAESELVVNSIFEVCGFTIERVAYLGPSPETHIDFNRLASQGTWRYRPASPARLQAAAS